jgi:hypothetical protein
MTLVVFLVFLVVRDAGTEKIFELSLKRIGLTGFIAIGLAVLRDPLANPGANRFCSS